MVKELIELNICRRSTALLAKHVSRGMLIYPRWEYSSYLKATISGADGVHGVTQGEWTGYILIKRSISSYLTRKQSVFQYFNYSIFNYGFPCPLWKYIYYMTTKSHAYWSTLNLYNLCYKYCNMDYAHIKWSNINKFRSWYSKYKFP